MRGGRARRRSPKSEGRTLGRNVWHMGGADLGGLVTVRQIHVLRITELLVWWDSEPSGGR